MNSIAIAGMVLIALTNVTNVLVRYQYRVKRGLPEKGEYCVKKIKHLEVSLENLINVIRENQGLSGRDNITKTSLLEQDLGITGDDGTELLETIENTFDISFVGKDGSIREAFGLSQEQFLFHRDGMGLLGLGSENVKPITVEQLYLAMLGAQTKRRIV